MASDKEFIDLFVRLKGDFNKLEKLKQTGIKLNAELNIKKSSLNQLEKLKKSINVTINLNIKGLDKLEKLKKGITVPLNLKTSGGLPSSRQVTSGIKPTSQQQYTIDKVAQFNAQSEAETRRRRIEADRQLKQLFEAQSFRNKQNKIEQQRLNQRKLDAKTSFESGQLDTINRLEAKAKQSTNLRRSDTDRQLKQLFEAQVYKNKQNKIEQQKLNQRKLDAKASFESSQLDTVNRLEARAKEYTKLRRADTDRQLKQLFEAQTYKERQRQNQLASVQNAAIARQAGIDAYNKSIAPFSNINANRDRIATQQAAIDKYNRSIAPRSAINQPELDAIAARKRQVFSQQARERLSQLNQRELNDIENRRKREFSDGENRRLAQEEFDLSPSFFNSGSQKRDIAFRRGLLPSDINNTKRKFIDPRRIANKESVREIGFAGLFGGLPGLAGAIAGGSIGGPGGSFIGATIAEKIFQGLESAVEKVTGIFEKLFDAGIKFEESILSISSSLQGFSQVNNANGTPASITDSLNFQTERARGIQLKARARLLPLGIGGNKESGIVGGIISSLTQKGITNFTDDDIAEIAGLLGAGFQSQIPFLPEGRARLETEDFFLQPGRNTIFNASTRAFTGDIQGASTIEEIKRALQGFQPVEEALTKNTENAQQALSKFNASINDVTTKAGSEFVNGLVPAIQELTKVLTDPKVSSAIVELSAVLGNFLGNLIKGSAKQIKNLAPLADGVNSGVKFTSRLFLQNGESLFNYIPELFNGTANPGRLTKKQSKTSNIPTPSTSGLKAAPRASFLLQNILDPEKTNEQSGIEQFFAGGLANAIIPLAQKEGVNDKALARNAITASGLRVSGLESFRAGKQGLFDSTAAGQASQGQFNLTNFQQQAVEIQKGIALKQKEIADINKLKPEQTIVNGRVETKGKGNLTFTKAPEIGIESQLNISKKLIKSTAELAKAEDDLARVRQGARESARQLLESFKTREGEIASGFNQNTLVGQGQSLNLGTQRITAEQAKLESLRGILSGDEFSRRSAALGVQGEQNQAALESQGFGDAQAFVGAKKALLDFSQLQGSLNDKLKGYSSAVESAKLGAEQAAISQKNASKALDDFRSQVALRAGNRQQQEIGAGESLIASTNDPYAADGLGLDTSLVKGSAAFDPAARAEFDRTQGILNLQDIQRRNARASSDENDEEKQLQLNKRQADLAVKTSGLSIKEAERTKAGFNIESAAAQINGLKQLSDLKNQLPEGSDIRRNIESQLASQSVQETLGGLGFKDFGQFENTLAKQREVKPGQFDQQTNPEKAPGAASPFEAIDKTLQGIASTVNSILEKMPQAPNTTQTKDGVVSTRGTGNKVFQHRSKKGNGLTGQEKAKLGSDIFGALSGSPEVSSNDIVPSDKGNLIASEIAKGLGSDPTTKLQSKLGNLSQIKAPEGSGKGKSDPLTDLIGAVNNLATIMSTTNPNAIGDKVKSALNSTFAGG